MTDRDPLEWMIGIIGMRSFLKVLYEFATLGHWIDHGRSLYFDHS
jgi:hypothetical protein